MTTNTETKTTEKKAPPVERAYKLDAEGKPDYSSQIAIWGTKSGKAKNFTINGQRYVIFPNTPKAAGKEAGA